MQRIKRKMFEWTLPEILLRYGSNMLDADWDGGKAIFPVEEEN